MVFGDKSGFGIEVHIDYDSPSMNLGNNWLWIAGKEIGNPAEMDALDGFEAVVNDMLRYMGTYRHPMLDGCPKEEVVAAIRKAIWGDDIQKPANPIDSVSDPSIQESKESGLDALVTQVVDGYRRRQEYGRFVLAPNYLGEAFDDVFLLFLEEGDMKRFIWKSGSDADFSEAYVPSEIVESVLRQFLDWYRIHKPH